MSALTEAVNIERHRGEMGADGIITKDLGYDILNFGRSRNDKMMEASLDEYQIRIGNVRDKMIEQKVDVLCVKNEDLRYLTGFHTIGDSEPQTLLLPATGRPIMVARLLETDLVEKYTWVSQWWSCLDSGSSSHVFTQALLSCGGDAKAGDSHSDKAVAGVDLTQMTAKHWSDLQASNPLIQFVDATGLVEKVRLKKSAAELENIQVAAECTRAGMFKIIISS
jgi:Xaa-Pro dipeptidase